MARITRLSVRVIITETRTDGSVVELIDEVQTLEDLDMATREILEVGPAATLTRAAPDSPAVILFRGEDGGRFELVTPNGTDTFRASLLLAVAAQSHESQEYSDESAFPVTDDYVLNGNGDDTVSVEILTYGRN